MAFENEIATGQSLLHFEKSEALRNFEGVVAQRTDSQTGKETPLAKLEPERSHWVPKKVIAIDGSNITHRVRNGYPGADAGIVLISVVSIDLTELARIKPGDIPSPKVFNEMDNVQAVDAVLPGANVIRKTKIGDSPKKFFRETVFDVINGYIDTSHETLLETLRAITVDRDDPKIKCPLDDCEHKYTQQNCAYLCNCEKKETLFETDELRFHERFVENGSNGEVHGEVRHVLEILALINILRYFATDERVGVFRDWAFVLDGPLGVFGQPAWILPFVKKELKRINAFAQSKIGTDIVLFGVEKTGRFMEHFDDIDWTDKDGPRTKYKPSTLLVPTMRYIHRNIVYRPDGATPYGNATYYGRKVFYKTKSGEHTVVNTAMLNDTSEHLENVSAAAYPRIGDILDVVDQLSTYLYKDGFMPLVRAHAHAAIPLKRGAHILEDLFAK